MVTDIYNTFARPGSTCLKRPCTSPCRIGLTISWWVDPQDQQVLDGVRWRTESVPRSLRQSILLRRSGCRHTGAYIGWRMRHCRRLLFFPSLSFRAIRSRPTWHFIHSDLQFFIASTEWFEITDGSRCSTLRSEPFATIRCRQMARDALIIKHNRALKQIILFLSERIRIGT